MLTEDEYSEFYSICLDRDLAGEVKKAISQILNASPLVSEYFNIPKTLSGRMGMHFNTFILSTKNSGS